MNAEEVTEVPTRDGETGELVALTVQLVRGGSGSTATLDSIRVLQTWVGAEASLSGCVLVIQALGVARLSVGEHPWIRAFAELGGRAVISECHIDDAEHLRDAGVVIIAPQRRVIEPRTNVSVASAGTVVSVDGALVYPGDPLPKRFAAHLPSRPELEPIRARRTTTTRRRSR